MEQRGRKNTAYLWSTGSPSRSHFTIWSLTCLHGAAALEMLLPQSVYQQCDVIHSNSQSLKSFCSCVDFKMPLYPESAPHKSVFYVTLEDDFGVYKAAKKSLVCKIQRQHASGEQRKRASLVQQVCNKKRVSINDYMCSSLWIKERNKCKKSSSDECK